ncbi:MAG: hypothetical protein AAGD96_10820 [Chloroflexota bacterium]
MSIFVLFLVFVLPNQAERSDAYTGEAGSSDSSFYYSPEELYAMAEAYGEVGRQQYIRSRFTFDVIWPAVYTFFLASWIAWTFKGLLPTEGLWQQASLAPIIGSLFDLLENVAASVVMARYPAMTPVVDGLATVFTMIKWTFINGSFVILAAGVVIGLALWVWNRFWV